MITVVARWDEAQLPPETEWRMYRQLRGAFKVDRFIFTPIAPDLLSYGGVNQFDTMEEALDSAVGQRVFLEATGEKTLADIPEDDIVLIIGNTNQSNVKHSHKDERYRIDAPNNIDLYGVNAAAIALAYRVN